VYEAGHQKFIALVTNVNIHVRKAPISRGRIQGETDYAQMSSETLNTSRMNVYGEQ
jgi:hypothetical protein